MPSISSLGDLLLLWVFLGAAIGLVSVAVRAGRIEREEGLPRSKYRVLAALGTCAFVGVLVLLSTVSAFRPAPDDSTVIPKKPDSTQTADSTPGTKPELDAEARKQLEKLKEAREQLQKQIRDLEKKIEKISAGSDGQKDSAAKPSSEPDGASTASETPPGGSFDFRPSARFLVPVILLVGVFLLLYLGDPSVLLRLRFFGLGRNRGELRNKALSDLNALAAAAEQGRFREGVTRAEALDVNLLERFDRLDWAYLKSYCAVQLAGEAAVADDERRRLLETAARALTTLLEEAPNRGEAVYLLAMAHSQLGQPQQALDGFTKAQELLPSSLALPFAHNQSVALLNLAEDRLSHGDAEGAGQLFDRVTQLKTLVDQIPTSLVKIRLLNVRRSLQANQLTEATQGLEALRNLEGLDETQRRNVAVICDALQALICVRGGDDVQIIQQVGAFLDAHLPPNLPEPDDAIADEYLDTPLAGVELNIAPQIYRAFFFLKAEVAVRSIVKQGRALTPAQVDEIARPLLRALQFELRQRDVLAALGGLTYWFVPEKKRDALRWIEAAVDLGVESRIARRLLERSRQIEVENREALEWFRSTAVRFLHDPTVSAQVRSALAEELGRFQGFQPLLLGLDLEDGLEAQEPTLSLVRERANYLENMVNDFAVRKGGSLDPEFDHLRKDYAGLIGALSAALGRMADVERQLVQAIGKTVLS